MKTLEQILEVWEVDCQIPRNDLAETSRQTPALHAKYLGALSNTKLRLKQAEMAQKILLKQKWLYYNGKMDQQEIERLGWDYDPLDGLRILKGEMDYYYDSDKEIQSSELKIEYLKTTISTLSDIVDALKWRHQTIGNIIKWKVFEAGG
jgi:hypothetical protein|tara:strand:+ start:1087 stop:1533 length:447 start_codon:yes stop_codon:yes gene_type:complete